MAPPTKYSAEQIEFMATFHNQFLECKANRNYEPLWNPFFEAWAEKFPERAVVFKDIPLDVDLTEEQSTVLAEAWALRQQRLMEKFRNDLGASKAGRRANGQHTATVQKMMKNIMKGSTDKPTRVLQPWEMYSKTHYTKVKDAVKTEQEELKKAPFAEPAKKTTLGIVKRHLKAAFKNESEEVKAEVLAAIEAMKEAKCAEIEEAKKQDHDKDAMCSYISKIAAILTQFFEELHEMTDWVFTVLMGGPHPAAGGTLDVSSFHVGTTKLGNRFSQAYPQFSQNIMVPYTQFVERVFPDAAALSRAQSLTSSTPVIASGSSSTVQSPSDISPPTTLNTTTAMSDALFDSQLAYLMDDVDIPFFSEPYASLPQMDMDDTLQPSLPILPMPLQPPQDSEMMDGFNLFLQDPSILRQDFPILEQDLALQHSLPTIPSPPRIHQTQNALILTDEPATTPNEAGAQPQPYHTTNPTFTFTFPISTPPPSQAPSLTTHILSGTMPPAGALPTQTLTPLSDAAPRGPPSDNTGKKRACESEGERLNVGVNHKGNARRAGSSASTLVDERVTESTDQQDGRGKRQRFQSRRAAEANNIGGSSATRKTGRK
ncbi:hypothetical protein DEU56DRAFT_756091 [Suillus clintonianus]|uniref:uncharacterized protein n=1 Tax=Suillus clintonianus TaxID=1904413 RepID=UPI001B86EDD9|nr:uncharacterized protein DEU56DRAFT_756091 [Suillus clintonianus]KAG2137515.1 hypothetical protein DEU56DRAFT_756091 [Suillus clintonianus]